MTLLAPFVCVCYCCYWSWHHRHSSTKDVVDDEVLLLQLHTGGAPRRVEEHYGVSSSCFSQSGCYCRCCCCCVVIATHIFDFVRWIRPCPKRVDDPPALLRIEEQNNSKQRTTAATVAVKCLLGKKSVDRSHLLLLFILSLEQIIFAWITGTLDQDGPRS